MKRQIGNHTRNTDPALAPPVQLRQLQSPPWRSTIESLNPDLETSEIEEAETVQAKFGHNFADIPFSEPDPPPAEPNTSEPNVQADFERELNQAKAGGSPLDNAFREKVEPAMGADFSGVKVHTDDRADQLSQSIQAKAFTTGNDIFFKQGEYEPRSQQGQELLAHELTHVVQQSGKIQRQQTPLQPGHWNPPGKQPIPFYIGNEAHLSIAAEYMANHPGNIVFTNFITISTILKTFQNMGLYPNIDACSKSDLYLKPDILNASRHHLYEIKPESAKNQALNEALMYAKIFALAGITITLGPIDEPGTQGLIPAPGGFYVFWSPIPGVIVYNYGKSPQPIPKPVAKPVTKEVQKPAENSDFMKKMSEITGLTGMALVIYLILSEGSRLFPARNLVPIL